MAFANQIQRISPDELAVLLKEATSRNFPLNSLTDVHLRTYISNAATVASSHPAFVLPGIFHAAFACAGETRIQQKVADSDELLLDVPLSSFTMLVAESGGGKSKAFGDFFMHPLQETVLPIASPALISNKPSIQGIEGDIIQSKEGRHADSVTITSEEFSFTLSQMLKGCKNSESLSELNSLWSGEAIKTSFKTAGKKTIPAGTVHLFGSIQPRLLLQHMPELLRGSGFLERCFVMMPKVLLPSFAEKQAAKQQLNFYSRSSLAATYSKIYKFFHSAKNDKFCISFTNEAFDLLESQSDVYRQILNDNTNNNKANQCFVRHKELLAKLSAGIAMSSLVVSNLFDGAVANWVPLINRECVEAAIDLYNLSESTKVSLAAAFQNILAPVKVKPAPPTTTSDSLIFDAIAKIPGPVVTMRLLKRRAPAKIRCIPIDELEAPLAKCRFVAKMEVRPPGGGSKQIAYRKLPYGEIDPEGLLQLSVPGEAYTESRLSASPPETPQSILAALRALEDDQPANGNTGEAADRNGNGGQDLV